MRSHTRFVDGADGTQIAWDVRGRGEPAILLCNGITTNTVFWRRLAPRLEQRHRVITFDLRGHGDSAPSRTQQGATIEGLADDALRVLREADARNAVIVGLSMGCQVAIELALKHPDHVLALGLLLGPAGRVFDHALGPVGPLLREITPRMNTATFATALRTLAFFAQPPVGPLVGQALGLFGPGVTREELREIVTHWRRVDPTTLRWMAISAARYDARARLRDVIAPALVVAGDKDVFAPADVVGHPLHEALGNAQLLRIDTGTHASTLEHAAEIGDALEQFLADLALRPQHTVQTHAGPIHAGHTHAGSSPSSPR